MLEAVIVAVSTGEDGLEELSEPVETTAEEGITPVLIGKEMIPLGPEKLDATLLGTLVTGDVAVSLLVDVDELDAEDEARTGQDVLVVIKSVSVVVVVEVFNCNAHISFIRMLAPSNLLFPGL